LTGVIGAFGAVVSGVGSGVVTVAWTTVGGGGGGGGVVVPVGVEGAVGVGVAATSLITSGAVPAVPELDEVVWTEAGATAAAFSVAGAF
jgi:hypothetical protein